jgi:hypothetical protein
VSSLGLGGWSAALKTLKVNRVPFWLIVSAVGIVDEAVADPNPLGLASTLNYKSSVSVSLSVAPEDSRRMSFTYQVFVD